MRRLVVLALLASSLPFVACSGSDEPVDSQPSGDDAGDASVDAPGDTANPDDAATPDGDAGDTAMPDDAATDADADAAPPPVGWDEGFALPGISGSSVGAMTVTPKRWLYVGGTFHHAGSVPAKNVAVWNGLKWLALGDGLPGHVWGLAADATDEVWAAVEGKDSYSVWHWDKTKWNDLAIGADGMISSIDVGPDGSVWIAGMFENVAGKGISHVARYKDGAWTGTAAYTGYAPTVIRATATGACIGGGAEPDDFGVLCWNGTTWTSMKSNLTRGMVKAIRFDKAGNMVIGGEFANTDAFETPGSVARWNATTSKWELVGGGVSSVFDSPGNVTDVALDGDKVYVTGRISNAGGMVVRHIAMWDGKKWWDLDGGLAKTFGVSFGDAPMADALAIDDGGELYAGGLLTRAGGKNAMFVAHWNGTTWSGVDDPTATRLGINGSSQVAVPGAAGEVWVGGSFSHLGGDVAAENVARLDATGWHPLGGGLNDMVTGLAVAGPDLYAVGRFSGSGMSPTGDPTVAARGIARWNGTSWSGVGGGLDGDARKIAVAPDGKIWVTGEFTHAGTLEANRVAIWDGTKWSTAGAGIGGEGWVYAGPIVFHDGKVYVAGRFTKAGTADVRNVAVWDGTTWSGVGAGFDDAVDALTVWDGKVVAAGSFKRSGDAEIRGLAAWDGTTWTEIGGGFTVASEWGKPHPTGLAVHGSTLFATGILEKAGSVEVRNLAGWDGSTWTDLGGLDDLGEGLMNDGKSLWVTGPFGSAGGKGSLGVARYWFGTK